MKLSESWLRQWVNPECDTNDLIEQLTMAGLEVDGVEPVAGDFSGVVVGEIVHIDAHPDAEKLRVCKVQGSDDEPVQVVCGAANARKGIKIPFATIGAVLPGNFKIKKAKLRGVESFGMLCAQTELEAGDDDDGLWELPQDAPVGTSLREYLALDDKIIEVDLTPNRSDCFSVRGIAREVALLNQISFSEVAPAAASPQLETAVSVNVMAQEACPRYLSCVVDGVNLGSASPTSMSERLRRSGIRSIDPIVDITNYVMLELGQPMHAFDLDKVRGAITVRFANEGEKLVLLDEQEVSLKSDTLVIADDSGAIAIAGVMGGKSTSVTDETNRILFESAHFNPVVIAGKARQYGLHTESSMRFERGVDFNLPAVALNRALELLNQQQAVQVGPVITQESTSSLPNLPVIALQRSRLMSGLGFDLASDDVVDILGRIGLDLVKQDDTSWQFQAVSHRFDIRIDADLLEELARVYGYNNLPTSTMKIPATLKAAPENTRHSHHWMDMLISRNYQEVITYSFIDPQWHQALDGSPAVSLLNPISADLSVMRRSLIPGLLKTLSDNVKRQKSSIRIVEKGLVFLSDKASVDSQQRRIAGLVYGEREVNAWQSKSETVDFYDTKGDVEALLNGVPGAVSFVPANRAELHPGQSADILVSGKPVGYVGALHPNLHKLVGVKQPTYVFELDLGVVEAQKIPDFSPISKQPAVSRDLAFVVDQAVHADVMRLRVAELAGPSIKSVIIFDVYQGQGMEKDQKSIAFNLTYQDSSRTLNDEEINASISTVVAEIEGEFDAKLR